MTRPQIALKYNACGSITEIVQKISLEIDLGPLNSVSQNWVFELHLI